MKVSYLFIFNIDIRVILKIANIISALFTYLNVN
jgi:hypothetical protein